MAANRRIPPFWGWIIPTSITFLIYLFTMCRTVYVGDSGEFSLVLKTLGIAHPPGYPLFTLVGHAFLSLTAFFNPAFSANLFGALLAVAVVPALFLLLQGRERPWPAAILTLIWTFSRSYWSETAGVEVYALNLLLIVLLAALALGKHPRKWFLIAYLMGLSLAHHLTALAVFPALFYLYLTSAEKKDRQHLPVYSFLFCLGISVYLYLPFRSSLSPLADWGHPASLSLLLKHVTASQYQQAASYSLSNLWSSCQLFYNLLLHNWWWVGLLGIIAGLWVGWRFHRRLTVFALILLVSNLLLASFYRIPDIDSYYLPGLLACLIIMANGCFWLWDKFQGRAVRSIILLSGMAAVLLLIALNFGHVNRSDDRLAYDYGKLILDGAGAGTVFTHDDNASFSALYLRYAEGYRPQVEVYDRATRLQALRENASALSGRTISTYDEARMAFLQCAPGPKFLVKSHFPYAGEWYRTPDTLYSAGLLYATMPPEHATSIPNAARGAPADYKSRQMLINLELCRGEEDLLRQTPADSLQAVAAFRRAQQYLSGETRGALHNQLGIFFRHVGLEELALASYDQGLAAPRLTAGEKAEIIFNISNVYKDRGNRLAQGGDYSGAVEAFIKALENDPQSDWLIYNIGVICVNYLHQPQRGLPYLESYLRAHPEDQNVGKLVGKLRGR